MRKRFCQLTIIVCLVLGFPVLVSAQGAYLGLRGGPAWSEDARFGPEGQEDLFEFGTGYTAGAALGYTFASGLLAEAEYSFLHNPVNTDNGIPVEGSFRNSLFMANLGYDFGQRSGGAVKPYVGFGIGVVRVTQDHEFHSESTETRRNIEDDWTDFVYQARAGVGFGVTDALDLSAGYRYIHVDSNSKTAQDGVRTIVISALPHHVLEFGVAFRF